MKKQIKIGYELDSGEEVKIPLAHTVITGLTQESGKTTCITALVKRSGLKALIIKTKIGEKAISEGTVIPPFYKEDFDWEYASELLESSRKEKLKFERSWIIKYSKDATSLLEFKRNIDDALAEGKLRELEKSVLITLQAYLEKILPELQYAPLSKTLDLRDGINIMDLERFKEETQNLIIRSALNEVLNKEKNCIIVIPECWKYLPEKYNSPVKRPAEAFIRQGATNNNYLFLDSQDVTGISKVILKQVSNWLLGYQREINEIERTLDQIPMSKKDKPKAEDVATLKLGQFYVATSDFTKKIYAQPIWLEDKIAVKVAKGEIDVGDLEQPTHIAPYQILPTKPVDMPEIPSGISIDYNKKLNELRDDFISNRNDFFTKFEQINETVSKIYSEIFNLKQTAPKINEDEIVMRVLQKIPVMPNRVTGVAYNFNKEEIIMEVLKRIPSGAVTYEVAPLEKITKDFLQEAKNKILSDISTLSNDSKKTLKYLESRQVGCRTAEIVSKGFFLTSGGGNQDRVNKSIKELIAIGVAKKDAGGTSFGMLKDRIKELLTVHNATEQEIEQIYNHILVNLLGGNGNS